MAEQTAATHLLSAIELGKLENLAVRARTVVEGALAGMHRSPHHGASVEFAEHKEYAPGDEIKHIDWKAFGKFDRYYVKRFEEETELRCTVLVDTSASMGYRGAPDRPSKLDWARLVAAALGWLLVKQKDQIGMVAFASSLSGYLPVRGRGSHLHDLLDALEELGPGGATDLPRAVTWLSESAHRRSLLVVVSDLLPPEEADGEAIEAWQREVVRALRGLAARKHDVVVFQILDEDELTLPFVGTTELVATEGSEARLLVEPSELRASYLEEIRRWCDGFKRALGEGGVEYHQASTATPPSEALIALLRARERVAGGSRGGSRKAR